MPIKFTRILSPFIFNEIYFKFYLKKERWNMFCDFRQFFALLTTKTIKKVPFGGEYVTLQEK